jgi:hypothetical protein
VAATAKRRIAEAKIHHLVPHNVLENGMENFGPEQRWSTNVTPLH